MLSSPPTITTTKNTSERSLQGGLGAWTVLLLFWFHVSSALAAMEQPITSEMEYFTADGSFVVMSPSVRKGTHSGFPDSFITT